MSEREAVYQLHIDKEQQYNQIIKTLKDRVCIVLYHATPLLCFIIE